VIIEESLNRFIENKWEAAKFLELENYFGILTLNLELSIG
jgi:hypothetical protein